MTSIDKFYRRRFLVTGASGFIGSALLRVLGERGAEPHALARSGSRVGGPAATWWRADAAEFEALREVVRMCKPDIVFHLAGYAYGRQTLDAVLPSYSGNLTATVNLLRILAETGCEKVVLSGSFEEGGTADEVAAVNSPYAASKVACDVYARMFRRIFNVQVANPRIFMVYGPGKETESKLISYLISSYLNDTEPKIASGGRLLDWIYIDDAVEGLIAVARSGMAPDERVDIGSGDRISVRELAAMLHDIIRPNCGVCSEGNPVRKLERSAVADIGRTEALIGWKPSLTLKEGLARTVDWHRGRASEHAG